MKRFIVVLVILALLVSSVCVFSCTKETVKETTIILTLEQMCEKYGIAQETMETILALSQNKEPDVIRKLSHQELLGNESGGARYLTPEATRDLKSSEYTLFSYEEVEYRVEIVEQVWAPELSVGNKIAQLEAAFSFSGWEKTPAGNIRTVDGALYFAVFIQKNDKVALFVSDTETKEHWCIVSPDNEIRKLEIK